MSKLPPGYYKEYYDANKQRIRDSHARYKQENPAMIVYNSAKQRATIDGLEFKLVHADVIVPAKCPIFNVPFQWATEYAPSLDRIDNTKGYIRGNIWVISNKANRMKSDASIQELLIFCRRILEKFDDRWITPTVVETGAAAPLETANK